MWEQAGSEIVPYQWLLRAIGDYLDHEGAARIQILETPEGFTVRYECRGQPENLRVRTFPYDELLAFKTRMEIGRANRNGSSTSPGSYQDFLRALGHELESASAYFILLDEVGDDFLVTYQYLRPSESYLPHKHLSVINRAKREDLLQSARGRRMADRRSWSSLLGRK